MHSQSTQTASTSFGEPSGPKVYFRVIFGDKLVQYKLSSDSPFKILFARINVRADFLWHGIVLDATLTPVDYNMLPYEENCATIHVVQNASRLATHAEEIVANDALRALAFKLRLSENKNEALMEESDQLNAQMQSLHKELDDAHRICAGKMESERSRSTVLTRRCEELEHEVASLKRSMLMLQQQQQQQQHVQLYSSSGSGVNSTPAAARSFERTTPPLVASSSSSSQAASHRVYATSTNTVVQLDRAAANTATTTPKQYYPQNLQRDDNQSHSGFNSSSNSGEKIVAVNCVFMDEQSRKERALPPLQMPESSSTLSNALRLLQSQHAELFNEKVMICLQLGSGEYSVVDQHDFKETQLTTADKIFVARMAD